MTGLALAPDGSLVLANGSILSVAPGGAIQTIAGQNCCIGGGPFFGYSGTGGGVAADAEGDVYVTVLAFGQVRKISMDGSITVVAGSANPTNVG
jgi:hypothetical protein